MRVGALLSLLLLVLFTTHLYAGISYKNKTWKNGHTLKVVFRNGTTYEKDTFIHAVRTWEKYVNLKFVIYNESIGEKTPSNLKKDAVVVRFDPGQKAGSTLAGTDINGLFGFGKQDTIIGTRGYGEELLSICLHEFGHVLALAHEHSHPDSDKYITEKDREPFMTSKEAKFNFMRFTDRSDFILSEYDPKSIMHYRDFVDPDIFESLEAWSAPSMLSVGDRLFAAQLYPKPIPLTLSDIDYLTLQEERDRSQWMQRYTLNRNIYNHCYVRNTGIENLLDPNTVKEVYLKLNGKEYLILRDRLPISLIQDSYLSQFRVCDEGIIIDLKSNKCSLGEVLSTNPNGTIDQMINTPYGKEKITALKGMSLEEMLFYSQKIDCFDYSYPEVN